MENYIRIFRMRLWREWWEKELLLKDEDQTTLPERVRLEHPTVDDLQRFLKVKWADVDYTFKDGIHQYELVNRPDKIRVVKSGTSRLDTLVDATADYIKALGARKI